MPVVTAHPPGTFSWLELHARDRAAAERFYTQLFGWTPSYSQMGPSENDIYVTLQQEGHAVAAMYAMGNDDPRPSAWLSYVTVASADQAAAKARELGGTVAMEPMDVMDYGRMAVISDPDGAVFAVWEPRTHIGIEKRDESGTLCWNELATNDAERAGRFYAGLFGWTPQPFESTIPYAMFQNGETMAGGMYEIQPDMEGMPPCWLPYLAVDDADDTARRARELGGRVLVEPMDIPQVGRSALLQDPQGGMFYAIKLLPQPAPES